METVHATHTMTGIGTKFYLAPEVYFGKYNNTVDIYSLGLVLYQLLNVIINTLCFQGTVQLDSYDRA